MSTTYRPSIPERIAWTRGLRASDRSVLAALAVFGNYKSGRDCRPAVKHLVTVAAVSRATVFRALERLEAAGFFTAVEPQHRHPTVYHLNLDRLAIDRSGARADKPSLEFESHHETQKGRFESQGETQLSLTVRPHPSTYRSSTPPVSPPAGGTVPTKSHDEKTHDAMPRLPMVGAVPARAKSASSTAGDPWLRILGEVELGVRRGTLPRSAFYTGFHDTTLARDRGTVLEIAVPSSEQAWWITKHLQTELLEAAKAVRPGVRIAFVEGDPHVGTRGRSNARRRQA